MASPFRFDACPTCCEQPNCQHCADGSPEEMQIVLSGSPSGFCASCSSLMGTYVLTFIPETCYWRYIFPSPICGVNCIGMSFDNTPGTPRIIVVLGTCIGDSQAGTPGAQWILGDVGNYNCSSWSDLTIPFSAHLGLYHINYCNMSSVTCKVTAL